MTDPSEYSNLAVAEGFLAWEGLANCARPGVDPEIFFPERRGRGRWAAKDLGLNVARALAVCEGCPVTRQCRQLAQDLGANFGVWGGVFLGTVRVRGDDLKVKPVSG